MYHLYEVVFESPSMWMKVQTPGDPEWDLPAFPMLQARFGGTTEDQYEPSFSIPFPALRAVRSHLQLGRHQGQSAGWLGRPRIRLAKGPTRGATHCRTAATATRTRAGWTSPTAPTSACATKQTDEQLKSQNAWHFNYIRGLEKGIANRDQARSRENDRRAPAIATEERAASVPRHIVPPTVDEISAARADALNRVNRLMAQRYYCQIEGRYHPCSAQVRLGCWRML